MADHNDPYMLQRDHKELNRLDTQHQFIRALCHYHLIHPSIPCQSLQAVADVVPAQAFGCKVLHVIQDFQVTRLRPLSLSDSTYHRSSFRVKQPRA